MALAFSSLDGRTLDPGNFYHAHFVPVLRKSGIRKIRLHDLRDTLGSLLIQRRAAITQSILRHKEFSTTMEIYTHGFNSVQMAAQEKVPQGHWANKSA